MPTGTWAPSATPTPWALGSTRSWCAKRGGPTVSPGGDAGPPANPKTKPARRPSPAIPPCDGRCGAALADLPLGQREAFVLVHLEGFSVAEAGELTGRAPGTIKSHLHRASRKLRTALAHLAPEGEEPHV